MDLSSYNDKKIKVILHDGSTFEGFATHNSFEYSYAEFGVDMEIIIALVDPTVAEFSRYAKLSGSNTAYRLRKLEEKGYIVRMQNEQDKREFHVKATSRYREEYGEIFDYIHKVCERIEERFSPEEVENFSSMLGIISE